MAADDHKRSSPPRKNLHLAVSIIWAAIMVAATFLLDDPGPVLPFWLLLIGYYIVVWGKSLSRS